MITENAEYKIDPTTGYWHLFYIKQYTWNLKNKTISLYLFYVVYVNLCVREMRLPANYIKVHTLTGKGGSESVSLPAIYSVLYGHALVRSDDILKVLCSS